MSPRIPPRQEALELVIILDENVKVASGPAWKRVIDVLKEHGIWGATVSRGIAGFGRDGQMHRATFLATHDHLPVVVTAIDNGDKLRSVIAKIGRAVPNALITTRPVTVHYALGPGGDEEEE